MSLGFEEILGGGGAVGAFDGGFRFGGGGGMCVGGDGRNGSSSLGSVESCAMSGNDTVIPKRILIRKLPEFIFVNSAAGHHNSRLKKDIDVN